MVADENIVKMSHLDQQYLALKESFVASAILKLTEVTLKPIVENYANVINSKRRSSYIKTLADLIAVLEERCYLSKEKVDFFVAVASTLSDTNVNEILARYQDFVLYNNSNYETGSSVTSSSQSCCARSSSQVALPSQVTKLVVRDIGTDWKDLVRELDFREGDINAIEAKHPRNQREHIREALKLFEQDYPPERQKKALTKALDSIGRRDIREHIEDINW